MRQYADVGRLLKWNANRSVICKVCNNHSNPLSIQKSFLILPSSAKKCLPPSTPGHRSPSSPQSTIHIPASSPRRRRTRNQDIGTPPTSSLPSTTSSTAMNIHHSSSATHWQIVSECMSSFLFSLLPSSPAARETKTVNAWFQNKRASSKKRVRGGTVASYESQPINTTPAPHPSSVPHDFHRNHDMDDMLDDEYAFDTQHSRSASVIPSDYPSSLYAGHSDQTHFYTELDNMPRRMRMRTSSEQTDELKKLYSINPHPTTEQRQMLAASIGM